VVVGAVGATGVAVANAVVSQRRGIYDWRRGSHRLAFALDSSWNLVGTTSALVLHVANALTRNRGSYDDAASRGSTYHVYDGGITLRRGFAFTFGNVVTNARGRRALVERHEALHVWQQRVLGPAYPVLYGAWMAGGALVGTAVWAVRGGSWFRLVETAAYYDNPFEYAAYRRQGQWPPARVDRRLAWGGVPRPGRPTRVSEHSLR
jgi:hypothetical protein